jgi:membrane associated rhomboid family serine protease
MHSASSSSSSSQSGPAQPTKVEFEDRPAMALFTGMLIMACIWAYIAAANRAEFWLSTNCWSTGRIQDLIHSGGWPQIASIVFMSNIGCFNTIHMALNMYFFWVFGGHVEGKLGSGRYLPILLLGATVPWFTLLWDTASLPKLVIFGPVFLISTILGAYLVVPPVPMKKFGGGSHQPKNQIFKKEEKRDPRSKYVANPWIFFGVFTICQVFFHFWITTGIPNPIDLSKFLLPPFGKDYDNFRLLPTVVGVLIGYLNAQSFVNSAADVHKEGPLAVAALKKYRELRDLDVQHEEALRGAARALGLSYDKVRELINRNQNKMRLK